MLDFQIGHWFQNLKPDRSVNSLELSDKLLFKHVVKVTVIIWKDLLINVNLLGRIDNEKHVVMLYDLFAVLYNVTIDDEYFPINLDLMMRVIHFDQINKV